ncbi:MAG: aromatic ring-hydroxylating dioxygenase subunit alpha, partial [Hyphomonadaceae bacterium]
MRREVELALMDRMLACVDRRAPEMALAPALRAVSDYTSPARFAAEEAVLFRDYPLLLAHSSQMPNPGDYLTHDLTGAPILLVRDGAGLVRAFLNTCRHRGARLIEGAGEGLTRIGCPFHAWNYDLEGAPAFIPQPEGFAGLDRAAFSLTRLPCVEKYGFIWVKPTPGGEIEIDAFLAGMGDDFAHFEQERFSIHPPDLYRRKMNWKLALDNFLEIYHINALHRNTIADLFKPNLFTFDQFGPHFRRGDVKANINDLRAMPREQWRLREVALASYFVFPNAELFYMQNHLSIFTVFPNGIGEMVVSTTLHTSEAPRTDAMAKSNRVNWKLLNDVLHEDFG